MFRQVGNRAPQTTYARQPPRSNAGSTKFPRGSRVPDSRAGQTANRDLAFLDPVTDTIAPAMNNPLLTVEAARWNKIGRRWSIILAVLLTVNLSLVVVAVSGYVSERFPTQANGERTDGDAAGDAAAGTDSSVDTNVTGKEPGDSASQGDSEPTPPSPEYAAIGEQVVIAPVVTSDDISPSLPVESGAAPAPDEPQAELVIINPPTTGGVVRFLLNEIEVSLEPGQGQRIAGQRAHRILFHRGDEFENVELTLEPGVFAFSVTKDGWQLEAAGDKADELLQSCRHVETN
jgi:hypothetical protein